MVKRPRLFDPIRRDFVPVVHGAHVIDQYINSIDLPTDLIRNVPYIALQRQIAQ